MRTRLELHEKLCDILGTKHVYYMPPSRGMKYPAIRYELNNSSVDFADNGRYRNFKRWTITVIDENPDSEIGDKLIDSFDYCTLDRVFTSDNLNHFVYTLYF